jgi:Flp pilus assembly pilin Flp
MIQKPNAKDLARDTHGLSTVEYIILLVLVALIGITAWRTFGNTVKTKIVGSNNRVNTELDPSRAQ